MWGPTRDGISSAEWRATEESAPCQPTKVTYLKMYEADSFALNIGQGERGNIKELSLKLRRANYKMTAEDCLDKSYEETWTGSEINSYFQRTEEMHSMTGLNDKIWHVYDPDTGIGMTVRCTASLRNGVRKSPRLNIESLHEPDSSFRRNRRRLGGFCVTNDLGNKNKSPNTMLIEEMGYCTSNGPLSDAAVARLVCQNPALPNNGVGQCYKRFCNEYWRPYYESFESCFDVISNSSNPTSWEDGFCRAFNEPNELEDFEECKLTIQEFGWEVVINTYYKSDRPQDECIDSFEDLPDTLDECEGGVVLQVYEDGVWKDVKAFSEVRPLCEGTELTLCFDEYPELFVNQIRWLQKRETENCQVDKCSKENGFEVVVEVERETYSPTQEPTGSPTVYPTSSPSKGPTTSPTANPTTSPSKSPTKSPSTSPTKYPTGTPTQAPTTDSPTRSPSMSPTSSPTKYPTGSPTKSPSGSPTARPTLSPVTPEPTPAFTTGTESPTLSTPEPTRSTETPTASPTPEPTLEPRDPVDPPFPTRAPTSSPTSALTSMPSAAPTECKEPVQECPMDGPTVVEALPEGTYTRIESGTEVVWIVTEPISGISTKIRCTSNNAFIPRLGIEDLIDPTPEDRIQQCGYCKTSEMGRTGDTANTDFLDANGNCSSRPKPVEIAQSICAPYAQFETFGECVIAICSARWFPNFNSPKECEKKFKKEPEEAFCTLFNTPGTPDFEECVDDIIDFGWGFAADKYLINPNPAICSSDPKDFPKGLSACQTGAEIQYLDQATMEWVTYVAIPSESLRPVCASGLEFNAKDNVELFKNPVRVKQTSLPRDTCITVSTCTVTQRVSSELTYSRSSTCSNPEPGTPSGPITLPGIGVTLCNNIYDSDPCSVIPQLSSSPGSYTTVLREMPECCAPKDTANRVPEMTTDHTFKFSRYSQTCNPICDYNDASQCCNELDEDDKLNIKVVFSGSMRDAMCCVSCTCYGDPRCIGFNGKKVSWIPCDARDAATANERKFCLSTKEKCENTVDPAGNKCVWFADEDTSRNWNILKNGGACKAVGEGEFSCLTMYKTETFGMSLKQGDRGVIVEARVRLGAAEYLIDAQECLKEDQPWKRILT